jgi:hypothetical protein
VKSAYLSIDKVHDYSGLAFMALEGDRFDEDLNRANSEDCAAEADELVDQVALDHRQGEDLVEVSEANL